MNLCPILECGLTISFQIMNRKDQTILNRKCERLKESKQACTIFYAFVLYGATTSDIYYYKAKNISQLRRLS